MTNIFAENSYLVKDYDQWQVRLMNDQRFPWVLIIPHDQVTDFQDYPWEKSIALYKFMYDLATAMKQGFQADKMNMATIGNITPQLHYHVVARFTHDAVWPKSVWGHGEPVPYDSTADLDLMIRQLLAILPD